MLFSVIASGDSAKDWIPRGATIGSNDAEKWGKPVDILILANSPHKFKERLNIIKKSKAKVLTTSVSQWKAIFPNCEKIQRVISFNKFLQRGFVVTSQTTPIMCLSLAIRMGATEIVLWGCDFLTHRVWRVGTKGGDREVAVYKKFFSECKRLGIKVWLGANGTAFDNVLPLFQERTGPDIELTLDRVGL